MITRWFPRVAPFIAVGLAVAGAVTLVGWAARTAPAAETQWVIALAEEGESLDPPSSLLFTSEIYQQHLFEPLVGIEGPDLQPVGLLAERWENVSPTTWRFFLRRGVKFHNGEALDAEDVKYSFDQYADPGNRRLPYSRPIERVEVRDPYTVDVVTREPFAALLTNLTRLVVLPKDTRSRAGVEGFAQHPVGTGAYRFVEWRRDQRLVLEASPTWWRGTAKPQRLVFRSIKDPSTRTAELRTGGVDVIVTPPVPQLEMLDSGDTQVLPVKGGRMIIHPFNMKQKPFDDLRVRRAANLAVDREAIVRTVLGGRGVTLAGPFTSAWLGFDPAVKPWPHDPERAKQLLAEAGYAGGFETTWSISSGVFLKDTEIAEAVASQLRKVGIRVKLVPTERAKIQKDATEGTFQGITSVAWGAQFEPDPMLSWVFVNRPHVDAPRIIDLIGKGRREVDLQKRRAIYGELYRLGHDEAVWLFIHAQDELWAKRRAIAWQPYSITGSRAVVYYFEVPPLR